MPRSRKSNDHPPSSPNGQLRGVLYARVSSEEQRERQTIETQIDEAVSWFAREGITLVGVYRDEGVSGTIPLEERPDGKRLLADAQAGKFNLVAVYKVDRLGRADLVAHVARHHLETLGVGLRSITEPFDLTNPYGRFMFAQFASFAALERSNFLERSMAGTIRKVKEGLWVGIVPYGYRREGQVLCVNEEPLPGMNISEAEVVRMMYRWAAERQSTLKIARTLNAMGIPPHYTKDGRQVLRGKRKEHTAGKWFAGRVRNLLRNETYMGVHHWGKRPSDPKKPKALIRRTVPAIVSLDLWQQTQDALRKNLRWSPRNSKRLFLFRGLLRCGFCGRKLSGRYTDRDGIVYYFCNGQLTHIKDAFGGCPERHIPEPWLEGLVWNELKDWILNYTNLEATITEALKEQEQEQQAWARTLVQMRREVVAREEERQRIIQAYRKGLLSDGDLERQLGLVDEEKRRIQEAVNDVEQRHRLHIDPDTVITAARQQLNTFRAAIRKGNVAPTTKRKIFEQFVKEIRVRFRKRGRIPFRGKPIIVETIPFRATGEWTLSSGETQRTLWKRSGMPESSKLEEDGTVQVIYNFPFPPKPQDVVSITPHIGKDSWQKQA